MVPAFPRVRPRTHAAPKRTRSPRSTPATMARRPSRSSSSTTKRGMNVSASDSTRNRLRTSELSHSTASSSAGAGDRHGGAVVGGDRDEQVGGLVVQSWPDDREDEDVVHRRVSGRGQRMAGRVRRRPCRGPTRRRWRTSSSGSSFAQRAPTTMSTSRARRRPGSSRHGATTTRNRSRGGARGGGRSRGDERRAAPWADADAKLAELPCPWPGGSRGRDRGRRRRAPWRARSNRRPMSVGSTPVRRRSNNGAPTSDSNAWMLRDNAGWVM